MIGKPLYIAMEITRKCNLNCIHCFEKQDFDVVKEMDDEIILEYIHQIKIINPISFCICGGEPSLRLPLIEKILLELKDSNINLSMVTNGTLLTKDDYRRLREEGLGGVQISLDGAKKETHDFIRKKSGCYENVIKAIDSAVEAKLKVSLSFTCMKCNMQEFEEYCELVEKYVDKNISVVISPIINMGNASKNREIVPEWSSYRKIVRMLTKKNEEWGKSIFLWRDPLDTYGEFSRNDNKNSQLYINCKGEVVTNPYIEDVVFSLEKYSLMEAWEIRRKYYSDFREMRNVSIYQ